MKTTLQENNGGGWVCDSLDCIERNEAERGTFLDDLGARVTTLEGAAEKREGRLRWR